MPDSLFGYRLLFLLLFVASSMTWGFLWLVGYTQRHRSIAARSSKPARLAAAGLLLVLACAALDFFQLAEHTTLLLALIGIGLVIPWGMVLIIKSGALASSRKSQSHN